MQLDQTRIAIRERGFGEILGLALQVTRAGIGWLFWLWLLGCAGFALLNGWLLFGVLEDGLYFDDFPYLYWFLMLVLVAAEAPFATAPLTLYLGKMMFKSDFRFHTMVVELLRSLPQLVLFQGLLRTVLLPVLLMPYWTMPYLGELVLLERNPLFRGARNRLTTSRRSRNLHANNGGELLGRWVLASGAGAILVLAIGLGIESIAGQLTNWDVSPLRQHLIVFPVALWVVVGWMTVVRFLSYLDMRIRREGWEVELLMRAEAQRLRGPALLTN